MTYRERMSESVTSKDRFSKVFGEGRHSGTPSGGPTVMVIDLIVSTPVMPDASIEYIAQNIETNAEAAGERAKALRALEQMGWTLRSSTIEINGGYADAVVRLEKACSPQVAEEDAEVAGAREELSFSLGITRPDGEIAW